MRIYFHVGLGKTGTKFLQNEFFPRLRGVYYIRPEKYKIYPKIIGAISGRFEKVLLSREFDRQFEDELLRFSQSFGSAHIIAVFRRHDSWILSQYKRFLKNGFRIPFDEFFNLNDTGFFRIKHLMFSEKIKFVERLFGVKPCVLIYDELVNSPHSFLRKIADYIGVKYDESYVKVIKVHSSYGYKSLAFAYFVSSFLDFTPKDNLLKKYLYVFPVRYSVLFLGNFIPSWMVRLSGLGKVFPDPEKLEMIRNYFEDDWNFCLSYASNSSQQSA